MATESITVTLSTGSTLLASAKLFSSGRRGFYAGDKTVVDGVRYQVSLSIVKIGTPDPADIAEAATQAKVKLIGRTAKQRK